MRSITENITAIRRGSDRINEHIAIGNFAIIRDPGAPGKIFIIDTTYGSIESMSTDEEKLADHIREFYAREF